MGILIMVGAITFCVGGVLGALISRSLFPPEQQKLLEDSLSSTRAELEKYQHDVAQHFADTAALVNNLTQSYREVHEHLARGAVQLTSAEIGREILRAGDETLGIEAKDLLQEHVEAPRDWAPKAPGQKGALSEDYGLDDYKSVPEASTEETGTRG